jgi:hypothetical protein
MVSFYEDFKSPLAPLFQSGELSPPLGRGGLGWGHAFKQTDQPNKDWK